jgi:hypothetical protein
VKLKPDSEYPDWLWNLNVERNSGLGDFEPNSKEYWEQVMFKDFIRKRRLQRSANKQKMVVGKNELRRIEWIERIKHRAILAQREDAGFDPSELTDKLDFQLTHRPQVQGTVYMDEIKTK